MSTGVSKIVAQRNHRILLELALKPGNGMLPLLSPFGPNRRRQSHKPKAAFPPPTDICADCKARAPRWASYNLGIFIWCAFVVLSTTDIDRPTV